MPPLTVAFMGSLAWTEVLVILAAALMIFGGNLPEVALRLVAQVMRARRAVSKMWRDTGLEDELRRVRRDIENNIPRDADFDLRPGKVNDARQAAERARLAAAQAKNESEGSRVVDGEANAADGAADGAGHHDHLGYDPELDPDAERRETFSIEADPEELRADDGERVEPTSMGGVSIEPAEGSIASGDEIESRASGGDSPHGPTDRASQDKA